MKWTEEKIIQLKELKQQGLSNKDIAIILECTPKSVNVKSQRLGIKSIYLDTLSEVIQCKECGKERKTSKKLNGKFCSKSCSAKYNNRNKSLSEQTKEKIKKGVNEYKLKTMKKVSINRNFRSCKRCKEDFYCKTARQYCENCRASYYNIYRPSCEFTFNPSAYKDKLENYNLIEKFGLYSPTNKGNNLKGISRDHMVSVKWGFDNNISSEIIKHPANCKLMLHKENNIKKTSNSISYKDLLLRIENW